MTESDLGCVAHQPRPGEEECKRENKAKLIRVGFHSGTEFYGKTLREIEIFESTERY